MKKILGRIIGIIIGLILAGLVGFIALFILINFPFILMHSETKITEEDKLKIKQYTIETFGENLELVRYDRYSNASGTKEKMAIYKVNNKEFKVVMSKLTENEEWRIYDTFLDDYILGKDEMLSKKIPKQLQQFDFDSSIGYTVTFGRKPMEYEDALNTEVKLEQYKKDINNLTREEILYREKEDITVYYKAEFPPESNMEDFETAIYELYKVMKSSGMGKIDILIEFGLGNYQTGKFDFDQESDYPVNSPNDLKQFYTK